ncbi:N-acetylmuramoyl-L-alanine amidase [Sulfurivermis fontis]|uniref:N-acetylmuramoyl-L-alanine amidase n=1 Tax=Sulfurivermis fontis TaxID=1972068 RepID=UPI000FD73379|nr:N-acetylmuramoyl-L-alanine amidase [Sulfurivermis fontis]
MTTKAITALLLLVLTSAVWADAVTIRGVRMWPAPDNTRLVFDVTGDVEHSLFMLKNPDRLVIDLKNTRLDKPFVGLDLGPSLIRDIRSAPRNGSDLRVVLDLKGEVRPKSFVLRPNNEYGHRLVIDLYDTKVAAVGPAPAVPAVPAVTNAPREIVIAIDAGHGGEDPGAIGPRGTREKDVTLAVAKRLRDLVEREPGMRAVMIRDSDYFVKLQRRVEMAREHRADLFISIHADAFADRRARGASVYTLSQRGASSEHARLLADKENASDIIGGVSLDDKDDLLTSVLFDLSLTGTMEASTDVASRVLSGLGQVGHLHRSRVEQAGFRVLKSPNVPSILVETAFISNPDEERKLRDPNHQYALASSIMDGVRAYFRQNPPPGTLLAVRQDSRGQQHVIGRGDTLSGIARQYQVSLEQLRSSNDIKGDQLRVGDVLRIPAASGG